MAQGICSSCAEDRPTIARGLCTRCYQRAAQAGVLGQYPREKLSFVEGLRRAQAAETPEGCWPWPKFHSANGYPTKVSIAGVHLGAHVASWTVANGPVLDGKCLDHLCHTDSLTCVGGMTCAHRRCVRPDHLEPVTAREQQARRPANKAPTCKRGHDRSEHTVVTLSAGSSRRQCRLCKVMADVELVDPMLLPLIERLLTGSLRQREIAQYTGLRQSTVSNIGTALRLGLIPRSVQC